MVAKQYANDACSPFLSERGRAHAAFDGALSCFIAVVPECATRRVEHTSEPVFAELGASKLGLSQEDVVLAIRLAEERYSSESAVPLEDVLKWSERVSARMESFVHAISAKWDNATNFVVEDPEIMSGLPCFAGTRVPIDIILGSLDAGDSLVQLTESYPFLTEAHVLAARTYALCAFRRRGPPRLEDLGFVPIKPKTHSGDSEH